MDRFERQSWVANAPLNVGVRAHRLSLKWTCRCNRTYQEGLLLDDPAHQMHKMTTRDHIKVWQVLRRVGSLLQQLAMVFGEGVGTYLRKIRPNTMCLSSVTAMGMRREAAGVPRVAALRWTLARLGAAEVCAGTAPQSAARAARGAGSSRGRAPPSATVDQLMILVHCARRRRRQV